MQKTYKREQEHSLKLKNHLQIIVLHINKMKRSFVGPGGEAIEKGKRTKNIDLNENEKTLAITYAIQLTCNVCENLKIDPNILNEIMAGTAVFNISYRIHQYMRGIFHSKPSSRIQKINANMQSFLIKSSTHTLSSIQMKEIWDKTYENMKGEKGKESEFVAKTHSIICLMQLFHDRIKELQIGPDSWIRSKTEGNAVYNSVESFGICNHYRHFLSGVSWDLGLRSTLSKFTSGMCQLALLSQQSPQNVLYSQRNKTAVDRAYNFIPQISTISDFVMHSPPAANGPILQRMAHITALHGDKHKRRCSIPFSFIWKHCIVATNRMETDASDSIVTYTITNADQIGFSSKKAALIYRQHCKEIIIPGGTDKVLMKQLVFHAFFGTHGEDHGVLEAITNCKNWMRREHYSKEFLKSLKQPVDNVQKIEGVICNYYSKNVSSSTNKMMAQSGSVFGISEVFSGYRNKRYNDDFLQFVRGGGINASEIINQSAPSIVRYLDDIIVKLLEKIKELQKDSSQTGTCNWHDLATAGFTKEQPGDIVGIVPKESSICFWSNS